MNSSCSEIISMLEALAKTIRKPWLQLPIALGTVLLSPLAVIAEPKDQACETARSQIEQTRNTLRPLEQHQQHLQQHVRAIYQKLFACQTGTGLSLAQQKHCTQLLEEGPKQFQAMVEAITLSHETSQQLAHQTRHVQLACPTIAENTFPKTTSLPHLKKFARNN